MSAWTDYANEFLPAVRYLYTSAGLPAWLPLAMAAHESGVPPLAGSTLRVETNPWGVRPWSGSAQYGQYCGSNGCFVTYPSLLAAAGNLLLALGPQRLQYASNPVAFMHNLGATGWDAGEPGYRDAVLYTWGPPAQAALQAIGADPTTANVGGGGGGAMQSPSPTPIAPVVVGTVAGAAVLATGILGMLRATGHLRSLRERRE